jgi:hypothetical protein
MMQQYFLLPLIILLIILYISSYFLYTDNYLKLSSYKLVWNIVLITSSLVVGVIGLVMIIFLNLEILPIDSGLIFWHVEAGIVTVIAALFHIHIYWIPFKKNF